MKKFFQNRKTLYFILSIVMIFIFTLTVVYAALNTVLKITGNAEVVASSWDIYLDNVELVGGSVTSDIPIITDKTTVSFFTTLKNPGDYYMFTVDVVNNGSINAMIEGIEKLPDLSLEQAKYLNYIVEYQNGESINTKQLVEAKSFVRLKVKVMLRSDVVSSDLPQKAETLNFSFKVNYVQSDDSSNNVLIENDGKLVKVVKGDGTKTGDEVCIGDECFYVISSTDEEITMFAKYNLLIGNKFDDTNGVVPLENVNGKQDNTIKGWFNGYNADNPLLGTKPFSSINYWSSMVSSYPAYVYNENTYIFEYVESYKKYLESFGILINDARLIKVEELESLGCVRANYSCGGAPKWVYSTTYWTGDAYSSVEVWNVLSDSTFYINYYASNYLGVRPVIVLSRSVL